MGATLVGITTGEVRDNDKKDSAQQFFTLLKVEFLMQKDG